MRKMVKRTDEKVKIEKKKLFRIRRNRRGNFIFPVLALSCSSVKTCQVGKILELKAPIAVFGKFSLELVFNIGILEHRNFIRLANHDKTRIMAVAFAEQLLGLWGTTLPADEKGDLPAFRVVYEFKDGGHLAIHAEGSPPTPGAYELELGEDRQAISLVVPVAMAPLIMIARITFRDPETLVIRFCDPTDPSISFLNQNNSSVEQLVLRKTQDISLSPSPLPPLSSEVQAMSPKDRKLGCIREYLATSMNAGVQAMQQENGLGSALKSLAESGGEGLQPLVASTYFHSALQMSSKHAHIFYRFGFAPEDVATLMNEPEAQQVAQECMMQQMAQLMGGQESLEAFFGAAAGEGEGLPDLSGLSLQANAPAGGLGGMPALGMGDAGMAGMGGMGGLPGLGAGVPGMSGLSGIGNLGMGGLGDFEGLGGMGGLGEGGLDSLGGVFGSRVDGMDENDQKPNGCPQQ